MKVPAPVKSKRLRSKKSPLKKASHPAASGARRSSDAARKPPALDFERSPVLQRIGWLIHGFSMRAGGATTCYSGRTLNLGFTQADRHENVIENRRRLLLALDASTRSEPWPLIVNRQVHSDIIHVVRELPASQEPLAGDGLITDMPGVVLAVLTADCLPVLLVDRKNKVIGAFHAGWRGTVQRIAEKGLGIMRREFGSRPKDVFAAIGPGIQSCCYEVGEELREKFGAQFAYGHELFHEEKDSDPVREKYPLLFMNQRAPGHGDLCIKLHLDLREANRRQLIEAGVPARQISASKSCTSCQSGKFFSHRSEKGHTGRMMAAIAIHP